MSENYLTIPKIRKLDLRPRPLARASEGKGLMRGARAVEDVLHRGIDTFWDHGDDVIARQLARLDRAKRYIVRHQK